MSDAPLNRFDRIVAILIQLQSKKIVKAQELADRFDVRRSATDSTNIRTVSHIGIVLEKDECAEVAEEISDSFQFEVIYTEPYIFKFYFNVWS